MAQIKEPAKRSLVQFVVGAALMAVLAVLLVSQKIKLTECLIPTPRFKLTTKAVDHEPICNVLSVTLHNTLSVECRASGRRRCSSPSKYWPRSAPTLAVPTPGLL